MNNYRIKYSVKGVVGQAETVISSAYESTAKEMVINQNGGKAKVTRLLAELCQARG